MSRDDVQRDLDDARRDVAVRRGHLAALSDACDAAFAERAEFMAREEKVPHDVARLLWLCRTSRDSAEAALREATDRRDALAWAASPGRLVARDLTPDEAAELQAANARLWIIRGWHHGNVRNLWAAQGLLLALVGRSAEGEQFARLTIERTLTSIADDEVDLALALEERGAIMASQWQEAP